MEVDLVPEIIKDVLADAGLIATELLGEDFLVPEIVVANALARHHWAHTNGRASFGGLPVLIGSFDGYYRAPVVWRG